MENIEIERSEEETRRGFQCVGEMNYEMGKQKLGNS
jgi:hypothetical protein